MHLVGKMIAIVTAFTVGFFAAYGGIRQIGAEENVPNIFLGKQDSPIEVFIITDWFCPYCQKVEPEIEKAAPNIAKKAKIIFVDWPFNPESANYTPYNLSFLTYEKEKYMDLRKALFSLTKKTKEPTLGYVQEAIAALKVSYKPLSFIAVATGMKYYEMVCKELKVRGAPAVVVRDTKTKKLRALVGGRQITQANIEEAVDAIAH